MIEILYGRCPTSEILCDVYKFRLSETVRF